MSEIGIGSKVWVFDINQRKYPDGAGMSALPIWREHWREQEVIGETKRSWLIGYAWNPTKIPKKRENFTTLAYSQEEIDNLEWVDSHRHKIARRLERVVLTAEQWKQIAAIIGYDGTA
jgi:hypothetical protein